MDASAPDEPASKRALVARRGGAFADLGSQPSGDARPGPRVREASAVEVFNIPLFEIPPMPENKQEGAVQEGSFQLRLFQRILDHDEDFGWCLQHPFVIVHCDATRERAGWLADLLRRAVAERASVTDFDDSTRKESLLRRLSFQCREVLLLRQDDFAATFGFCCTQGPGWQASAFFERLGPLPRCMLLRPRRIYVAGRQVQLKPELLAVLGVKLAVVSADALDVIDHTSGGGQSFPQRSPDALGVRYLKCEVADSDVAPEAPQVLEAAAAFLAQDCAGAALVKLHGQSRSASAVCAYLVGKRGLSVDAAWRAVDAAGARLDARPVWWDALRGMERASRALADEAADEAADRICSCILAE